jgi:ATP-dependent DNA helicase RecG
VLTPTGFGFLLFGNEPRNAIPQAGVLANAKLSDDKSSRKEFGQAMVLIPGLLEEWLNMVLPSTLDRSRMERMEQMRSFSAPMKSRNPVLHYVFARMGLAEEQGFGLTSLKMHAEKLGLPLPSYSMEGDFLVLTIYRSKAAASLALGQNVLEKLSKAERVGWEWLATKEKTNSSEYAESLKLPYRTAMNHLKKFQNLGLLEKSGSGRATEYTIHPR